MYQRELTADSCCFFKKKQAEVLAAVWTKQRGCSEGALNKQLHNPISKRFWSSVIHDSIIPLIKSTNYQVWYEQYSLSGGILYHTAVKMACGLPGGKSALAPAHTGSLLESEKPRVMSGGVQENPEPLLLFYGVIYLEVVLCVHHLLKYHRRIRYARPKNISVP